MISKYKKFLPVVAGAAMLGLSVPAMAQTEDIDSVDDNQVQIAYRTIDKYDLLGGVATLDFEELQKKNYINDLNNTTLNGYVAGFNGNSLWGLDASNLLVLVDGMPRDLNNVISSEVKEITFLKGAQAVVLYGSRAANGVIYITTKRGGEGPLQINVRANTGWAVAKSFPEYLGAAEYMTLYNEALVNDRLDPIYSQEQIYNTAALE